MKKQFTILAVLVLAVFITACGGSEQDTTPDVPPAPETPEEPTGSQETEQEAETDSDVVESEPATTGNVVEKGTDKLGGGEQRELGSRINSVACDLEEKKVTFTFQNTGEYTWSLDQEVGFAAGGDLKNVKVFMNHRYEMNGKQTYFMPETGTEMFGPNEKFSDNCGGVTELATGESATCTLYPVPLNKGTGSQGLNAVNYILIDSPNVDDLIEFTC